MSGWIKYYVDGTKVVGDDQAVQQKLVSWRKTPLQGMCAAEIRHDNASIVLRGAGPFWQSDGYESLFPGPQTRLVKRRIECVMYPEDKYIGLSFRSNQSSYTAAIGQLIDDGRLIPIKPEWHNKWFVLEYEILNKTVQYYCSEIKI